MHEYGFELCGSHYPWGFFQLAAQVKRELFKGQLCGWESPYAEGQLVFQVNSQLQEARASNSRIQGSTTVYFHRHKFHRERKWLLEFIS